jgi:DNA modification methylase
MEIKSVPISGLVYDPNNARKHSAQNLKAIASSLEKFGQRKPIVVTPDNIVVAGNGTLQAATTLGWTEIVIARTPIGWTWDQIKAFALADNRTAELAEWDDKILADQLLELDANGWALEEFGFEALEPFPYPDENEDDPLSFDDAPTRAKLGDTWKLGDHTVVCGDSTDQKTLQRLLDGNQVDVVFTDPPYGFNYVKKSDGESIMNDGAEFETIIKNALKNVSCDTFFICGDAKTTKPFLSATSDLGEPKSLIVWVKPIQHRMHKFEPCHEFIWYWGHNGNPFYGENVFESKREIQKYHPTIKPVELIEYCLKSVAEKKNVLDLFGGSGSTLIACEKLRRKCFMIELDPKYVDVIIKRWEDLTGKTAELIEE